VPEENKSEVRSRMSGELASRREQSQLRELEILHGINLSSNDYLGLARRPEFKRAVLDAVALADSMGSTGSRLLAGNAREWEELESEFARFAGTESALYFGSGYVANVGLLSSVLKPGDIVFSDECNHASLIDGMRLSGARKVIYPHLDLEFLEKALDENRCTGTKFVVTESLFSMEGDFAPLGELVRLTRANGAELVIDEAHTVGTYGRQGRGFAAHCGIERDALAVVHTCGKALASLGAFVCGGNVLKQFLINHARTFIFTTAAPPHMAGQIRAALEFVASADAERAHLQRLAAVLRDGLAARGMRTGASSSHIVPVFLGSNEAALHAAAQLQAGGFAVKAIRPPTVPSGTARIRLSLTSKITLEDVRQLVSAIGAAVESAPQSGANAAVAVPSCLSASS
jgi:8-amino-7-oxononanoate synthase